MKVTQSPVKISHHEFMDVTFSVPLFQREYAWDLDQVAELFYDIENSNADGHFLGSLLLFSIDEKRKEIIDGQQRLTTIFLIFLGIKKTLVGTDKSDAIKAIDNFLYNRKPSLLIEDTNLELRLQTGKRDKRLFEAIIKEQETKEHKDGRVKSHRLLLNALDFISKALNKKKDDEGITGIIKFAQKVFDSEFIVMTAEKTSDKILLFKTLNARGMELSESDLIKNEICKEPKNCTIEEAVEFWDGMRSVLEKYKVKIDNYLYHFINAQPDAQELRKAVDRLDPPKKLYPPVPEKYIFSVYEEKIRRSTHTQDFLTDLKKTAENYAEFVSPPSNKIHLRGLKEMGITKCYPLLIRGKSILNEGDFTLLAKALECISFRHSIMRNDPKELEKLYYDLLDKFKTVDMLPTIIEDIKQHPTMKNEPKFKSEFINASPSENISKVVLQRIINSPTGEPFDFNAKEIWLEHIMPKTPAGEWKKLQEKDEELYYDTVSRIGNLTFIKSAKNIGASNNDFVEKKKIYATSNIQMTKDLVGYANWDWDTVSERQVALYEMAKDMWSL